MSSKGKDPAFLFYPELWLSDTDITLMSPAEEGAYIRLLCHAFHADDGGLPDDDKVLSKLSRLGRRWKASSATLRKKFFKSGDKLYNKKLLDVLRERQEFITKCSEAGKKSARMRKRRNLGSTDLPTTLQHRAYEDSSKDENPLSETKTIDDLAQSDETLPF